MSDSSYPLVTLASNNFYPGSYIAVNLGAGSGSAGAAPVVILLLGNALSTSTCATQGLYDGYVWGPDVNGFTVTSVNDVINVFGLRSELHRMYVKSQKIASSIPHYLLAVKESTGTAATGTTTLAGTATAPGAVRTYVGDVFFDTPFNTGDGYATIAANVVAASLSQYLTPATASNVAGSGVVTLTHVHKGPRGNDVRYAFKVISGSVGVSTGITSTQSNFTTLTGGVTADSWTNALATIVNKNFRYIVCPSEDASNVGGLGSLVAQVTSQALPIPGIRQRVVGCAVGSVGTANAFAKSLNNPRTGVVWQENGNNPRCELAALAAAGLALGENQSVPMCNYNFLGSQPTAAYFTCSLPFDGSSASQADLTSALASGVMPVANSTSGGVLVSAITTYSQDTSGNLDTRIRNWCIVSVCDYIANQINNMWNQGYANKKAANDPAKGAQLPNNDIVTPRQLITQINLILTQAAQNGLIRADLLKQMQSLTDVILDAYTPGRFDAQVNVQVVDIANQLATNLNQLSTLS